MYDTQFVAKRIKERAKKCGIKTGDMLTDLGLGVNTISHLSKGQEMSYLTFAKIADFYDVTVDYLLGRKTKPPTPQNPYLNFKPVAEDWETLQKIIESLPERERIAVITFLHMLSGESDLPTMEMQQSKMIPKGTAGEFRQHKEAEAAAEAEAQRKETA